MFPRSRSRRWSDTTRSRKLARAVGLNIDIKPTPSIALGAYEVTPLEIAGAYTVFTNNGDLREADVHQDHPRSARRRYF